MSERDKVKALIFGFALEAALKNNIDQSEITEMFQKEKVSDGMKIIGDKCRRRYEP